MAKKRKSQGKPVTEDEILEEIRDWYNGYRFSEREARVYNPYSTLRFLRAEKAESYWYNTAAPSFLIDQVRKHPQAIIPLRGIIALKSTLSDISKLDRINLSALMSQTGYLTIQDYNAKENSYCLDFPNREVRDAFFNSLLLVVGLSFGLKSLNIANWRGALFSSSGELKREFLPPKKFNLS